MATFPLSESILAGQSGHADIHNVERDAINYLAQTAVAALRGGAHMIGGGTLTRDASGVSWSARFLIINHGTGAHFALAGFFEIAMPPNGTVIPVVGSASSVTVTSGRILLPGYHSLFYILPIGAGTTSVPANFRIVNYGTADYVPDHWVHVATLNNDDGFAYFSVQGVKV
jgi:hypothetical protein